MSLAQDNFERASEAARPSLERISRGIITLADEETRDLQQIAFDLEAVLASIHMTLAERSGPQDFG